MLCKGHLAGHVELGKKLPGNLTKNGQETTNF